MALALMRRRWPLQLRADFQQFYNLNIDEMGLANGRRHAADLAVMLPRESRTVRAEHPELEWGEAEYLLAVIADAAIQYPLYSNLRLLVTSDRVGGLEEAQLVPIYTFEDMGKLTMA